jgi:hypothetical protein
MKLLERFTTAAPPKPKAPEFGAAALAVVAGRKIGKAKRRSMAVQFSADLARVMALPRRDLEKTYTQADIEALEATLRAPVEKCRCAEFRKPCVRRLLPTQAYALLEAAKVGGLIGAIGVGSGKTLIDLLFPMVMPGCKTALLLIPSNLQTQLLETDWHVYGGHWKLPNLVGGSWFVADGRPALHVVTHEKFSRPESTDLLRRIKPDTVMVDEAHAFAKHNAARTIRFERYWEKENPDARYGFQSGTLSKKSVKDSAHLFKWALRDNAPVPLHGPTLEEWSAALDPLDEPADPGELMRLCQPGEDVRAGYGRRRNSTPGVVATSVMSVDANLTIRILDPGPVPEELTEFIAKAHAGQRPDGEEFVEKLQEISCARQLSAGFFHRWRYPRGEPENVILDWFAKRQAFNRELRQKLHRPKEQLDSPGLLVKAAIRAYQDPPYTGEKPIWRSEFFPEWHDVHDAVKPETQAVWVSDFIVKAAAAWAAENVGIIWVEYPELGERIARAAKIPYYGGGDIASAGIVAETGDRSIVASIKAHHWGKNLQQFCRNLVVTPPADGAMWEQLIGRTHRQGQQADEVTVDVFQHTAEYRQAFADAREYARFIQDTERSPQRLVFANYIA